MPTWAGWAAPFAMLCLTLQSRELRASPIVLSSWGDAGSTCFFGTVEGNLAVAGPTRLVVSSFPLPGMLETTPAMAVAASVGLFLSAYAFASVLAKWARGSSTALVFGPVGVLLLMLSAASLTTAQGVHPRLGSVWSGVWVVAGASTWVVLGLEAWFGRRISKRVRVTLLALACSSVFVALAIPICAVLIATGPCW